MLRHEGKMVFCFFLPLAMDICVSCSFLLNSSSKKSISLYMKVKYECFRSRLIHHKSAFAIEQSVGEKHG